MTGRYDGYLLGTQYPAIRRVLREDYQRLDDEDLEDVIAEMFPGSEPDDMEDFMRSVQQFGRQAAPIAQRALPGVIQGAVAGGTAAGPYGALTGGILGGSASAMSSPSQAALSSAPAGPPRTGAPMQPGAAPRPASAPMSAAPTRPAVAPPSNVSAPSAPVQAASGSDALQRLLFLLSRPETGRALSSLLVSYAGRPTQPVAGRAVPAMAFANAIAELAGELVDSYAVYDVDEGEVSDYLLDEAGIARADLFNPAKRASLLVADMAAVAAADAERDGYVPDADWDEYGGDEWVEW